MGLRWPRAPFGAASDVFAQRVVGFRDESKPERREERCGANHRDVGDVAGGRSEDHDDEHDAGERAACAHGVDQRLGAVAAAGAVRVVDVAVVVVVVLARRAREQRLARIREGGLPTTNCAAGGGSGMIEEGHEHTCQRARGSKAGGSRSSGVHSHAKRNAAKKIAATRLPRASNDISTLFSEAYEVPSIMQWAPDVVFHVNSISACGNEHAPAAVLRSRREHRETGYKHKPDY